VEGSLFHSAQFNLDNDRCSATLTQRNLTGLCPSQLYKLTFFLALEEVAATDNCQIDILLAKQVFWRHQLPYPNLIGSVVEVENTLMGHQDGDDEGGYSIGDPSDFTVRVECRNMSNTEVANVWVDAFNLTPIILIP
jgi:hypothetical protein